MATYIQGITDYIPQIQPFNPNLNFYQAALERKEAQYKEGANKINGIYGSILNAPMLGSVDNETRDKFFKDVEDNITKISSLDLSKQENVDQAYQVFQPIINDKNIMKNIAWTKNYQNELATGEGYRNCIDEKKCNGKFWNEGLDYLKYQAEDFARAADNHNAGGIENPRYIPAVDIQKKIIENATALNIDVKTTSFSPDGRYMIVQKNGAPVEIPLSKFFLAQFGNDQGVKDMYKVKAVLERKNYMKGYATTYGSEDAAENKYLSEKLNEVNKLTTKRIDDTNAQLENTKAKQSLYKKKIEKFGANVNDPDVQNYLALTDQMSALKETLKQNEETKSYLDRNALLGADKKNLTWRIDNAHANELMTSDITTSTEQYAKLHSETTKTADPFALKNTDHMFSVDMLERKHSYDLDMKAIDITADRELEKLKHQLKTQKLSGLNGQMWAPAADKYQGNSSTGDIINVQQELGTKTTESFKNVSENKDDYMNTVYHHLKALVDSGGDEGASANADLSIIFGSDYDKDKKQLKVNNLSDSKVYNKRRDDIYDFTKKYIAQHASLYPGIEDNLKPIEKNIQKSTDLWYTFHQIKQENLDSQKKYIQSDVTLDPLAKEMLSTYITKNGLLDKTQFANAWSKQHNDNPEAYADALEKYDDVVALQSDTYKKNPAVKSWDGSMIVGGVGGKTAKAITTHIDSDTHDESLMDIVNIYKASQQNGSLSVSYGYGHDKLPASDEGAKAVLDRFMSDVLNNPYKESNEKRPQAEVIFSPIALGDPNKVAVHIIPDSDWADQPKRKGTAKLPGITASGQYAEGITIYMDKDKLPASFSKKLETSATDVILSHKDIVLKEYPDVGSITLSRNKNTGGVDQSGGFLIWNPAINGYATVPVSNVGLNPNMNGEQLENAITTLQKELHFKNEQNKQIGRKTEITNVNQLTQ